MLFTFKSLTDGKGGGGGHLYLFVLTDGESDGLRFPGTGCTVPDVANIYLNMKCVMYGLLFLILPTSLECFHFFFEKRIGLVTMDLFVSYLHFKLRILSWSVSGLGNESPCDVWGGECTV